MFDNAISCNLDCPAIIFIIMISLVNDNDLPIALKDIQLLSETGNFQSDYLSYKTRSISL